ncbi:MAG: hypothetical protein FJY76_03865 [Candidatus Aenigmarchaeota archaeon]|nr:hypothetical protein [Candidatus Aenigmarchaeota archaeon]
MDDPRIHFLVLIFAAAIVLPIATGVMWCSLQIIQWQGVDVKHLPEWALYAISFGSSVAGCLIFWLGAMTVMFGGIIFSALWNMALVRLGLRKPKPSAWRGRSRTARLMQLPDRLPTPESIFWARRDADEHPRRTEWRMLQSRLLAENARRMGFPGWRDYVQAYEKAWGSRLGD